MPSWDHRVSGRGFLQPPPAVSFMQPPPAVSFMPGYSIFWVAFETFCVHLFGVCRPVVVYHPPVGRTDRQGNIKSYQKRFCSADRSHRLPLLPLRIFLMTLFLLFFHVDVSPAATSTIVRLSCPTSAVLPGHKGSFAHFILLL